MIFKKNLIEMILLLVVVISFAWIGVHKQMVVPYNEHIIEGMDTESGDDVPGCNETVYSEYDPYSYDSKYILKTQIVPPVCPACPSVINNHDHGDNLYDGLVDGSGESITKASTEINETTQVSNSSNEQYTNVTNIENTTINNAKPSSSDSGSNGSTNSSTNNKMSDRVFEKQKSLHDGESLSENVSDRCPPCPACERCPEPAFTCEKVINYKSPSAKQYLPMPVLNDFSTFPSS